MGKSDYADNNVRDTLASYKRFLRKPSHLDKIMKFIMKNHSYTEIQFGEKSLCAMAINIVMSIIKSINLDYNCSILKSVVGPRMQCRRGGDTEA